MKNKFIFIIFILVIFLFSCENKEENIDDKHNHSFSNEINYDDNGHWYKSTCEHTEEKGSYEMHIYESWVTTIEPTETTKGLKIRTCQICQYIQKEELDMIHYHKYKEVLSYDKISHWYAATCEHQTATKDKEEHTIVDGKCKICEFKFDNTCIKFELNNDDSYTITGLLNNYSDVITIPLTYNNKKITRIDSNVFLSCNNLKKVYFDGTPDEWCYISLGNEYANPMSKTENFYFKINGVYTLIENLEINSKVINDYQFYNYAPLKSLVITDKTEKIGVCAFKNCLNIEDVSVPFIGDCNDSNYVFTYLFGVATINKDNISLPEKIKSITLTGSFLIKEYAFRYMDNLKELIIGDNILGYEEYCFFGLNNLENLELPFLSTESKTYSLSYLFSLRKFESNELNVTINSGTLNSYNIDIEEIQSLTLNNVSLGNSAFVFFPHKLIINSNLDSLKISSIFKELEYIEINGDVDTIKSNCFENYHDLKSVVLNGNVRKIENYAFAYCYNLEFLKLSDSLESIEQMAFVDCESLSSIILPSTLQYIGNEAFMGCYSLIEVYNLTSIDSDILENSHIYDYNIQTHKSLNANSIIKKENNILYYEKNNTLYLLKYLDNSLDNIVFPDYINGKNYIINSYAISYNSSVKTITLGQGITCVNEYAFNHCQKIENIIITNEDTILKYGIFNKFEDLVYNKFDNAYYLGTIDNPYLWLIKATYTTITSCIIHEDTKYIHQGAFANCSKLTTITIPSNVVLIQKNAFVQCTNLTNIIYNGNSIIE